MFNQKMKILTAVIFSLVIFASFSHAQVCSPTPSGLVAWYPGDGNGNDISGNNNHGTLQNGATFAAGKAGQAFSLDGMDDLISAPGNGSLNLTGNQVTIEAWIKLENNSTTAQNFTGTIGKNVFPNGQPYLILFESGPIQSNPGNTLPPNQWQFEYILTNTDGTRFHNQSTGVIITVDGLYHHFVMTYDGAAARLYVDGVLRLTQSFSGNLLNAPNVPVTIGGDAAFSADEVTFYNRVLSDAEIAAIFSAGSAGKCQPVLTAASVSVSGRVLAPKSRSGISRTMVSLTDPDGYTRSTFTNKLGHFRFEDVEAGQTYIFNVFSQTYKFSPRVITINGETEYLYFSPDP